MLTMQAHMSRLTWERLGAGLSRGAGQGFWPSTT